MVAARCARACAGGHAACPRHTRHTHTAVNTVACGLSPTEYIRAPSRVACPRIDPSTESVLKLASSHEWALPLPRSLRRPPPHATERVGQAQANGATGRRIYIESHTHKYALHHHHVLLLLLLLLTSRTQVMLTSFSSPSSSSTGWSPPLVPSRLLLVPSPGIGLLRSTVAATAIVIMASAPPRLSTPVPWLPSPRLRLGRPASPGPVLLLLLLPPPPPPLLLLPLLPLLLLRRPPSS